MSAAIELLAWYSRVTIVRHASPRENSAKKASSSASQPLRRSHLKTLRNSNLHLARSAMRESRGSRTRSAAYDAASIGSGTTSRTDATPLDANALRVNSVGTQIASILAKRSAHPFGARSVSNTQRPTSAGGTACVSGGGQSVV